jgi:hypothetical protein
MLMKGVQSFQRGHMLENTNLIVDQLEVIVGLPNGVNYS